jgi:hypothetical protein
MLDPLLLTDRGTTVGAISVGSRADFEAMNRASDEQGHRAALLAPRDRRGVSRDCDGRDCAGTRTSRIDR